MSGGLRKKLQRAVARRGITIDHLLFKKTNLDRVIDAMAGIFESSYFLEPGEEAILVKFMVDVLANLDEGTPPAVSLETDSYIKKLQSQLTTYVPREFVDAVMRGDVDAASSEAKTATVLFADIRGFTKMSQNLEPAKVVKILNQYLTLMYDMISKHGGVVDKFIGDGVMAVFADPDTTTEDGAANAVYAAIDMQTRFRQFKTVLGALESAAAHIGLGIGVNTGPMIIGNIGSDRRKDFTAIGAEVNFAANIMGKAIAGEILLGENTQNFLGSTDIKTAKHTLSLTHKRLLQEFTVYKVIY